MKILMILFSISLSAGFAQAYPYECSQSGKRCSDAGYNEIPAPRERIVQPPREQVMGNCGEMLPLEHSYQNQFRGFSCGEAGERTVRTAHQHDPEAFARWENMAGANLQNERQELLQFDLNWEGELDFLVKEHYSYVELEGDFLSTCNGYSNTEPYSTTCYVNVEEQYTYYVTVNTTCAEYYPEPEPSTYDSGGSTYSPGGSTYTPPSSPGSGFGGGSNLGTGFDRDSSYDDFDGSFFDLQKFMEERKLVPEIETVPAYTVTRKLAANCKRWNTREEPRTGWRSAGRESYSCTKTRNKFCIYPVTRNASRSCGNHKAKYSVDFEKDPNFKPGYVDASQPHRSYYDELPNKYDLLNGEFEKYIVYTNLGTSSIGGSISPVFHFDEDEMFNEYEYSVDQPQIRCEYGMAPEFNISVTTLGRIPRRAPNPLAFPVDEDGNIQSPISFSGGDPTVNVNIDEAGDPNLDILGAGNPTEIVLFDKARMFMLMASEQSRLFSRPVGAPEADDDANLVANNNVVGVQSMDQETAFFYRGRFKLQLFRNEGLLGRELIMSRPLTFSNDSQADVFMDEILIDLEGNDGLDPLMRGPRVFLPMFSFMTRELGGWVKPGAEHYIKIQVAQQSFPFYISGCDDKECDSDEIEAAAYSEPLYIRWEADRSVDDRTFIQKLLDATRFQF